MEVILRSEFLEERSLSLSSFKYHYFSSSLPPFSSKILKRRQPSSNVILESNLRYPIILWLKELDHLANQHLRHENLLKKQTWASLRLIYILAYLKEREILCLLIDYFAKYMHFKQFQNKQSKLIQVSYPLSWCVVDIKESDKLSFLIIWPTIGGPHSCINLIDLIASSISSVQIDTSRVVSLTCA